MSDRNTVEFGDGQDRKVEGSMAVVATEKMVEEGCTGVSPQRVTTDTPATRIGLASANELLGVEPRSDAASQKQIESIDRALRLAQASPNHADALLRELAQLPKADAPAGHSIARPGVVTWAKEGSHVEAPKGAIVLAFNGSEVHAQDGATVNVRAGSHVTADKGAHAIVSDAAYFAARPGVDVIAASGARVTAEKDATVAAGRGAEIFAKPFSMVTADAGASIFMEHDSKVTASGPVRTYIPSSLGYWQFGGLNKGSFTTQARPGEFHEQINPFAWKYGF